MSKKKLFLKRDVESLASILGRYVDLIQRIEKRHSLESGWDLYTQGSDDLSNLGEAIHNAHFWLGEAWIKAEQENLKGTTQADWDAMKAYGENEREEEAA